MIAETDNFFVSNMPALEKRKDAIPAGSFRTARALYPKKTIHIRPYRPEDRKTIYNLCCDTGFLGHPVDSLFQDRELFAELFTQPYLDYEPEWATVAESDGRVVGYLLGSVRRHFGFLQLIAGFRTSVKMAARLAAGCYAGHERSRKFVRWLLTAAFSEQPRHPQRAAHLHFDICKDYRGCGIGLRLWHDYERRLRRAGVQKCYGAFFSYAGRRPELVYARYGFEVFDQCRTTLFAAEIPDPVEVVCVCKDL